MLGFGCQNHSISWRFRKRFTPENKISLIFCYLETDKLVYLAGSHRGIEVHVPLLHVTGDRLYRNSYCRLHSTVSACPCWTTVEVRAVSFLGKRIIRPWDTCGTTQGAGIGFIDEMPFLYYWFLRLLVFDINRNLPKHFGNGYRHFPSFWHTVDVLPCSSIPSWHLNMIEAPKPVPTSIFSNQPFQRRPGCPQLIS